ncbi:MFS transporter, PCFT/HCP family, solute carrier family 46 (folate transporter), member 1/3 [Mytilus galloprovincialis]|uniref:MFS transporter, PCFT/HCP family, solute carrier family 46 (Folate transporter), member 1/3 n=1 Tax=Mytilus galloprovincialis TaxID=29158 RepID=A0A8B6GN65_MYTGA|nr:MFS transporter, PCFT/HCP family, solute carrier family 46 (folate transporter), member 1/3 [Mytilus galloprovincialis]
MDDEKEGLLAKDNTYEKEVLLAKDNTYEKEVLLVKEKTYTQCMSTRMKVMMYALIYNCAITVTTTIEPQFTYSYIKNHYSLNDTRDETQNNSTENFKTCDANSTSSDDQLQQLASDWSWYMQIAEAGVSFPIVVFAGPIADKIGRKPVLMWNLVITLVSFILKTVIVYRNMNLYYYTIACGILGLAGSFYTYQITNFAILADVTSEGKDRSLMMTVYDALSAVGSVSFQIGTGYLIQLIGFTDPYIITSGMFLFLCVLVQLTLTDSWIPPDKKTKIKWLKIPFELFSFCFKPENMSKLVNITKFIIYFVAYCLFYFPHCVVSAIRTIFQLGSPFCWTSEHIGWYGAGSDFVMFICGTLILKTFHSCCVGLTDRVIAVFGILSCMSTYIVYGLSKNQWILYGAIGTGVIRVLPVSLIRALLSEMVHKDKQGVLYSSIHVMETLLRIGGATLFNNIYHHTLSLYNGFVFFTMAGFVFAAFLLMMYTVCLKTTKKTNELIIEKPAIQDVDGIEKPAIKDVDGRESNV